MVAAAAAAAVGASGTGSRMGYDVRITRAKDWTENSGREIASSEWLQLAQADPDLEPDPSNGPFAMRYGNEAWFDWFEGNVFTSDPDRETVGKMLSLAERLDGRVQGDDGEFYDSSTAWPEK